MRRRNFHQNYKRTGQKKARKKNKEAGEESILWQREEIGRSENGLVLPVCSRLAIKNVDSKAKSTRA